MQCPFLNDFKCLCLTSNPFHGHCYVFLRGGFKSLRKNKTNLHRDLEDNENALLLNSRMSYPAGCELTPGELSCRLELNRYHAESCRFVGAKLPGGAQGNTQCRHEVGVVKHANEVPIKPVWLIRKLLIVFNQSINHFI